jgi:hypothetical protein
VSRTDGEVVRGSMDAPHHQHNYRSWDGAILICPGKCPDCGGVLMDGPDYEGFMDCRDCGAAWQPAYEWHLP